MRQSRLVDLLRAGQSLTDANYLPRNHYSLADMVVSIIGAAAMIGLGIYAWVR